MSAKALVISDPLIELGCEDSEDSFRRTLLYTFIQSPLAYKPVQMSR